VPTETHPPRLALVPPVFGDAPKDEHFTSMSKAVDVLLMKSFECVLQKGGEDALAKAMLNHLARVSDWAASQFGEDRTVAMLKIVQLGVGRLKTPHASE
jgi:hypothetical protein